MSKVFLWEFSKYLYTIYLFSGKFRHFFLYARHFCPIVYRFW